jgi:hypothetical protein
LLIIHSNVGYFNGQKSVFIQDHHQLPIESFSPFF